MIAQRCRAALVAELAIACQSSVFRSHLNEAGKLARSSGKRRTTRGADETVSLHPLRGPNGAAEAIHGAFGKAAGRRPAPAPNQRKYARLSLPYPLLIVRPSAASSACVATHSLHRST